LLLAERRTPTRANMSILLDLIESEGFVAQLLRACRNGLYFAVESRIPNAFASIIVRDILFAKDPKKKQPWLYKLDRIAEETMKHGLILAKIALIFKATEKFLANAVSLKGAARGKVEEWHTFAAGCLAGYVVMGIDTTNYSLKRNINMFIAMRTLWSIAGYASRTGLVAWPQGDDGRQRGWEVFVTLTWGFVMWHWRHQDAVARGEMPSAMARSMDYIYQSGDQPGLGRWYEKSGYAAAVLVLYRVVRSNGVL